MDIGTFWQEITSACHVFNTRVTSGPRSISWNSAVGGVTDSDHLYGFAADLAGHESTHAPAIILHFTRVGLHAINEGDHIHVQRKRE